MINFLFRPFRIAYRYLFWPPKDHQCPKMFTPPGRNYGALKICCCRVKDHYGPCRDWHGNELKEFKSKK